MSLIQILTRAVSGVPGMFRADQYASVEACFAAAEKVPRSTVWFPVGNFQCGQIDLRNVHKVCGCGPTQTTLIGAKFSAVYDYPINVVERRHSFEDFRLIDGEIHFGGSYGTRLERLILSQSLAKAENAEPRAGSQSWTEGVRIIDCYFYNSSMQLSTETQPNRLHQSFADFQMRGCTFGVDIPGLTGIVIGDHVLIYGGFLGAKFNVEDGGICMSMGEWSNVRDCDFKLSCEGNGIRLRTDANSLLSGTGWFIRDNPLTTTDWLLGRIEPRDLLRESVR